MNTELFLQICIRLYGTRRRVALVNIVTDNGYVPISFGKSHTVPTAGGSQAHDRTLTVDDFRKISESPVVWNVSERWSLFTFSDKIS